MTDRMWDRFVRSQYPPPKPEALITAQSGA